MEVTITGISRKDKTSKAGKPFVSLGIKTEEHGDKWLSGFGNAGNKGWAIGDKVEIEVEQKGEYLNFTTAKNPNGTERPTGGSTARLENMISLKVIPMLEEILAKIDPVDPDQPPF